jgi:hypothetical protein
MKRWIVILLALWTASGAWGGTIDNQGRLIDANGTTLVYAGFTIVNNAGILQASNGGMLQLGGGHWSGGPTYVNGGTIQALTGSMVRLGYTNPGDYDGAGTISGSTLNTFGTGRILAGTGMVLNNITNTGNLSAVNTPGIAGGGDYIVLAGTINNTGTITMAGANIQLYDGAHQAVPGAASLTGGGTLNMGGYSFSGNTANGASGTLTNVDNHIQGAGSFGAIIIANQSAGVIDANTAGQTLSITGSTINNSGILQASNGGTLQLGGGHWSGGPTYVNGGTIQALDGSTVRLGYTNPGDYDSSGTVTGSTLNTAGSGVILASTGEVLDGITNHGNLQIVKTPGIGVNNVVLNNTINNTGTITMAGGYVSITGSSGSATLTGGGTVNLGGSGTGFVYGTLTNADNHIQGAGGFSQMTLNNQSAGVIDANTSGQTMSLVGMTVNNSGTLQASNGGTLQIGGGHWSGGPTNISGGTIQALDGSTVLLGYTNGGDYDRPGTITGSTLKTSGSGVVLATENALLNGITNAGNLNVVNIPGVSGGQNVAVLTGAINNSGTITLVSGYLNISGSASLTGGGTVNLGGYYINGDPLTNINNTIQGSGYVSAQLTNQGTVRAGAGETLSIGNLTNYSGGTLTGGTYDAVGTIGIAGPIANNAATIILDGTSSSIVYGGTDALASTFADDQAAGTFELLHGRNFTTAGAFSNQGVIDVGAGSTLTIGGAFTNTGTLDINGTLVAQSTAIGVGQSLSGSGTIDGNVTVYGETDPGNSPGTLTVDGTYTQEAGSFFNIQLGGVQPGQFDQLDVNGAVFLSGTLDIALWGGFVPGNGNTFDILNWTGARTGSFDAIAYPTLSAGYSFLPLWAANNLTLEVQYQGNGGSPSPEPATCLLIGAGLLAGSYHWRRRRQIRSRN